MNHPPALTDQTALVTEDVPATLSLQGTDPDGDPLRFTVVTPPFHGSLGPIQGGFANVLVQLHAIVKFSNQRRALLSHRGVIAWILPQGRVVLLDGLL